MFAFNIYYAVKYETADSVEKNHHFIKDYICSHICAYNFQV